MTRVFAAVIFIFCALSAQAGPVRAVLGGIGTNVATCPQGTTYNDGCLGANINSAVEHANFFTGYAQGSGQTYTSSHPMLQNVPGVDYPVGNYTALASLTDISTSSASLTSQGCALASHVWTCTGSGTLDIENTRWDVGNATGLVINGTYTALKLKNNYFACGTNYLTSAQAYGYLIPITMASSGTVDVEFNTFEGNSSQGQACDGNSLDSWIEDNRNGSGSTTYIYNAFLDNPPKVIKYGSGGYAIYAYNYIENMNTPSGAHGEFFIANGITYTGDVNFLNNTFTMNINTDQGAGGVTTNLFLTDGAAGGTQMNNVNIKNNVFVSNLLNGSGKQLLSQAAFEASSPPGATYTGTLTITNNYIDKTGALGCYYTQPTTGTFVFSGNKLLTSGLAVDGFGTC